MLIRSICLLVSLAAASTGAAEPRHPIAAGVASDLADPESEFVMVVRFRAKPDQADALIQAMAEPLAATAKEPGNLAYDLSRDIKKPGQFVLYEHWRDVDALDAHLKQPYLDKLLGVFGDLLAEPPEVSVYVPIPAE